MMDVHIKSAEEINEMVNVYFKMIDKSKTPNWDIFDDILQQVLSFALQNTTPIDKFIDRYEDVMATYARRANRQEFPTIKYIVYLNFATVIQMDGETIDSLLRYGNDILYPKLQWPDKL